MLNATLDQLGEVLLVAAESPANEGRTRGQRPSAMNVVTLSPQEIVVEAQIWSVSEQNFLPGTSQRFGR